MTRIVYGKVFKQDAGTRRHGSSKVVHVLHEDEDGRITAPCSPGDVGIPVERFTEADVNCSRCRRDYVGIEVLDVVDATYALLEQLDAMILLDAIADHLGATAQSDAEKFQHEVLEHAIKEIRKSRGLDEF